jgi:hypothetical protein
VIFEDALMNRTLLVLFFTIPLFAAAAGSLTGTVADPSGAAIPAVMVIARNAATGAVLRTETDASGNYTFPEIPAGSYTLEAERAGFTTYTKRALEVAPGSQRFDIAMTVESHNDTVTVTDSPNQLQTVDTQTGGTLNATKMASIPVNGRSFTSLLALQPGVIPPVPNNPTQW